MPLRGQRNPSKKRLGDPCRGRVWGEGNRAGIWTRFVRRKLGWTHNFEEGLVQKGLLHAGEGELGPKFGPLTMLPHLSHVMVLTKNDGSCVTLV